MCWCCRLPANKIQTANTGSSIQRLLKTKIITLHNSLQVHVKFRVWKKVFIDFIFYIYLKRMGLNLSTNLPMFVYTFQAMWCQRPLKEYSVFVGIRVASTFFSLYTLVVAANCTFSGRLAITHERSVANVVAAIASIFLHNLKKVLLC